MENGSPAMRSAIDFTAYMPALRRYFMRRARDPNSVDDLVQEVMLRLHSRERADAIDNPEGYIFRTAFNVMRDNARRAKVRQAANHQQLTEDDYPVEELSADRVLQAREQVSLVVAALNTLPERARDAFVLSRFEGLSYAEIAERLGVSVSAVEKYVARAMALLTRRFGK